jgi:hypothetical protein
MLIILTFKVVVSSNSEAELKSGLGHARLSMLEKDVMRINAANVSLPSNFSSHLYN